MRKVREVWEKVRNVTKSGMCKKKWEKYEKNWDMWKKVRNVRKSEICEKVWAKMRYMRKSVIIVKKSNNVIKKIDAWGKSQRSVKCEKKLNMWEKSEKFGKKWEAWEKVGHVWKKWENCEK